MAETNPGDQPHTIEQPNEPYVRMDETREQELEKESHTSLYLKVWAGLAIFTALEYVYAHIFKDAFAVLVLGLMTMAIIKAAMVGWYFMHLKFEGKWVYAMLVPAGVLATIIVLALYPDLALQPVTEENPSDEEAESVWHEPAAVPPIVHG
ncbi:MAG: cytochrome C oxidase subunit IV family protein [Isosphaeraceae bacterium]|nr:cytochrome C oxidase subunit IV family protein [Isosphaeraceae bacterium]